jgi:hypothetical protein
MVRSGVGKTIGVGDETKGKLHANMAIARDAREKNRYRLFDFIIASRINIINGVFMISVIMSHEVV